MDLLAGQGVGLVREINPAGKIVRELVDEAREIISQRLATCGTDMKQLSKSGDQRKMK
jgi:hypothetical protein